MTADELETAVFREGFSALRRASEGFGEELADRVITEPQSPSADPVWTLWRGVIDSVSLLFQPRR